MISQPKVSNFQFLDRRVTYVSVVQGTAIAHITLASPGNIHLCTLLTLKLVDSSYLFFFDNMLIFFFYFFYLSYELYPCSTGTTNKSWVYINCTLGSLLIWAFYGPISILLILRNSGGRYINANKKPLTLVLTHFFLCGGTVAG